MKRNLILLMVFLLFSVKNLQAQEPKEISLDQIVQKVKEQKRKQKEYLKDYIFKSTETQRSLDKQGKVKESKTTVKKIYVKGEINHEEILSVQENGKFLDEKKIKEMQEKQDKRESGKGNAKEKTKTFFPFDPEENGKFDYYFVKEDTLNGLPTYLLKAEPKKKDENFLDDFYWIDQKSFGVLKEEQRLSKKQKFVKEMSGERIFQEIEIKDISDAHIFMPVSTKMKGEGGFLFMKKKFEMEMVYSEFQLNVGISDEIFPRRK
ncbi:MAG: hypothetical protein A2W07_00805 [candidate division Zixibacteria bacterium RBG_16_43_9]|nr:MAG: hypothetical protein A2W07_00805 [candidate division Zixibacteria bacterium RBG_16_43_9]